MDKNADTYVLLNLISDPRCFLHREIVEVLLKNNNDRIAVHEYVLSELGLQKNCPIFFFIELRKKISSFCSNFNQRWQKCHRMKNKLEEKYG